MQLDETREALNKFAKYVVQQSQEAILLKAIRTFLKNFIIV
jgi:hypothetical protein